MLHFINIHHCHSLVQCNKTLHCSPSENPQTENSLDICSRFTSPSFYLKSFLFYFVWTHARLVTRTFPWQQCFWNTGEET
ncbi:unnamed protein product [Pleuronectes platessa]|uniref:Uncharacterized protein n=1 Tax=Pleuronectes platessa TaxID=8262 RepID=A0A9N7ZAK4_PLEPL|nr:unnamed protein product [Pleuronectes platessa]